MKKLIFLFAILILGCTKIEQSYKIEVTYPSNTTLVYVFPFRTVWVEITAGTEKDTLFLSRSPQTRAYSGHRKVTSRELKNVI